MVILMLKAIKYIIKSIIIGVVSILLINLVGQFFSFRLPITILSIFLVGFLRLPGLLILLLYLILWGKYDFNIS